ncbi:hypothetical protein [Streptomyces sp. CRN 30]|uniref:hypothetical protein n=1 Tax=Streptomyces sp. CRN 30 TaxID=3075613 RepID=UPI002A800415|nr:hypothetical protein [Streptomyces sp. CRN 30]
MTEKENRAVAKGRRWSRGRVAGVTASVLLAGAVIVGTGYTVVTVRNADRDAGTPGWKLPAAADETGDSDTEPSAGQGLAEALVPFGTYGWTRGPDIGEFGSDAVLSSARAAALQRESLRGLPRSERKALEREIGLRGVKGMALRSYVPGEAGVYQEAIAVEIVLTRAARSAVREMADARTGTLDAFGILEEGPEIEGHDNARCFLLPDGTDYGDEGSDTGFYRHLGLDLMYCSAHVGEILVTATAEGVAPLETERVAVLLTEQLDRITDPGEAV